MNLRSVLSNKNNTECCGINITTKREGLQTLWRGLPPRLIASRRLRLRYLVGDGFAVRIPLLLCAGSPAASEGKDEQCKALRSQSLFTALFFVAEREGFVQSVASWATYLRVAVVCCRKSLSLSDDYL